MANERKVYSKLSQRKYKQENVEKDADDDTIEDMDWNTNEYDAHIETKRRVLS